MEEVQRVVRNYQSIDPVLTIHGPGEIGTTTNWTRLVLDITYYHGGVYLSMIDCGSGRLVLWRELRAEMAPVLVEVPEKVILV